MIGHGFIGALQAASYVRPPIRTTGTGPGTIVETAAGYDLSGFADTAFAWLDAPKADGKWYWEGVKGGNHPLFGVADDIATGVSGGGYSSANAGVYTSGGAQWVDGSWTGGATTGVWGGGAFSVGNVIGFALDLDSATKSLKFYRNGGYGAQVQWTSGPASLWPMFGFQSSPPVQINLGPAACAYEPPDGYAYL